MNYIASNQNDLEQFNSSEFIELARSSGLKVEHHLFSKQNFVSASHFLAKGKKKAPDYELDVKSTLPVESP